MGIEPTTYPAIQRGCSTTHLCYFFEKNKRKVEPRMGIEPTTYALRVRCSTPELSRRGGMIFIFGKRTMSFENFSWGVLFPFVFVGILYRFFLAFIF